MTYRVGLIIGTSYRAYCERSIYTDTPRGGAQKYIEESIVADYINQQDEETKLGVIVSTDDGKLFLFPVVKREEAVRTVTYRTTIEVG